MVDYLKLGLEMVVLVGNGGGEMALGAGGFADGSIAGLAMGLAGQKLGEVGAVAGAAVSRGVGLDTALIATLVAAVVVVATLLFINRPLELNSNEVVAK